MDTSTTGPKEFRMTEITSGSSFEPTNLTETGVCLRVIESENDLEKKKTWTLKS